MKPNSIIRVLRHIDPGHRRPICQPKIRSTYAFLAIIHGLLFVMFRDIVGLSISRSCIGEWVCIVQLLVEVA